jgi:hypothetical protein
MVYSVSEPETLWSTVLDAYVVPIKAENPDIPVIFSDTGTVDSVNAPYQPLDQSGATYVVSDMNGNGVDDGREQQANIFEALLSVNTAYGHPLTKGNGPGLEHDRHQSGHHRVVSNAPRHPDPREAGGSRGAQAIC